jgi:hypothetical protein
MATATGSKKKRKGGSPKKAIKRLRRRAIATLRQARLTAQLELLAAEAAAARMREQALAATAEETATLRADARAEVSRLLEQGRVDAASAAGEQRAAADAEVRAILAEAELKAARVVAEAEVEAQARREQIVADAMQEAVTIRAAATDEIAGFLHRLDDERARLLESAREEAARVVGDARAASSTEAARMRDATEQELELKSREILDAATAESGRILEAAAAEAKAKRDEADALAAAAAVAIIPAPEPEPEAAPEPEPEPFFGPEPEAVVEPEPEPEPMFPAPITVAHVTGVPPATNESPDTVMWRAETGTSETTTADVAPVAYANGAVTSASTNGHGSQNSDPTADLQLTIKETTKPKRRWGIFGRAR